MKTTTTPLLKMAFPAALAVSFVFASCSKTHDASATSATNSTTPAASTPSANSTAMTAAPERWDALKSYSYDQRTEFAAKANDYANRLDQDLKDAKGSTSNRLAEARDELRSAAADISNATADTWEATKDRVGRAWQKADSALQAAE